MSRASNLAGFVTSISPVSNLNVGVVTASSFVGNLTGNVTGTVTGTASTAAFATTSFGLSGSPDITVTQLTATRISAGSTTGTTGQVLQSTGTGIGWTTASAGGITEQAELIGYNSAGIRSDSWDPASNGRLAVFGQGNFQVFTSPGTFVVNPGISSIRVRVVGAGGNGGAGGGNPPGPVTPVPATPGAGGGGGGYAHKVITSFTAPRSYSVTVGSAPGGTSSFGSEVSATGGSNGGQGIDSGYSPAPTVNGGVGGIGTGGDVNFTGATGSPNSGANPTPGYGGAAATQKGNGSGASVPGLPSLSVAAYVQPAPSPFVIPAFLNKSAVDRFPFDVFWGAPGGSTGGNPYGSPMPLAQFTTGFSGGHGRPGYPTSNNGGSGGIGGGGSVGDQSGPTAGNGGSGGLGAGGGAGGGKPYATPAGPGGSSGPGGAGIVIVEW